MVKKLYGFTEIIPKILLIYENIYAIITIIKQFTMSKLKKHHQEVIALKRAAIKRSLAVLTSAVTIVSMCPLSAYAAMDTSEFASGYAYPTEMRGLNAFQIANDMGAGWNLGNSLESEYNETYWNNPKTTKKMIDAIAAKGFTTLRVPVRWDDHYSNPSNYTIDSSFMDRVETVVNYGLANDMYVILNVHHNDL